MEELFRFSVIRPASRATTPPLLLAGPPPTSEQVHQPPFQNQVAQIVRQTTEADPTAIWHQLETSAVAFLLQNGPGILADDRWTTLGTFVELGQAAISASTETSPSLDAAFSSMANSIELPSYALSLADLFVALVIVRRGGPGGVDRIVRAGRLWPNAALLGNKPSIAEVADRIRAAAIVTAGTAAFAGLDANATATAFTEAMTKPLAFANELFAPMSKPVHGVGFRELHVVKQAIRRYEVAEIARIENVLAGETRSHTQTHTLSNERDTFLQTDSTTEKDDELSSTDHVDIKNESQDQLHEDTKVDAGVHASYDGGSYKLQADLTVAYDKSTDETKKFASDVAKDVTKKASSKVTEKVTQSQATKIIETFEDTEL